MSGPVYFVWIENQRGDYTPQKWFGDKTIDGQPAPVAARHTLPPDGESWSLAYCAVCHPPPPARPPEPKIRLGG